MKAIVWEGGELGAKFHDEEIPADMAEKAAEARELLLDTALSVDTVAMEEYFEKGDVSVETLKRCIKAGAISGAFRPVLCGTAFKNKGVQPLLDAVLDYLPSPIDVPGIKVATEEGQDETEERRVIPANATAPFAGLAFKIINDKYGTLTSRARLCRHAEERRHRHEHHEGSPRADRPHVPDARRQAGRDQGSARGRHRGVRGPEGHRHWRHAGVLR